jgi:hypothetical protein
MDPFRELPGSDSRAEDTMEEPPEVIAEENDPRDDHAVDAEWAKLLHDLNNVLVSTLLNAQVMEWKLPSYSRLKRNLHEIERNAQRGGELVKRLVKHWKIHGQDSVTLGQDGGKIPMIDADSSVAVEEISRAGTGGVPSASARKPSRFRSLGADGRKVPHTPM